MNQQIVNKLHELAVSNNGRLTPDIVVAEAENEESPLREFFVVRGCFDSEKAVSNWKKTVARELIRSVRVNVTTETFSVKCPAFLRDPSASPGQGYASISRLRSDDDLAREAVIAEFTRASAALTRAKAIAAALNLSDEVVELQGRLDAFVERVSERESASAH
jgi:hypothetical protein